MTHTRIAKIVENLTSTCIQKPIGFNDFIDELPRSGELMLRNIFQLFHDMVHSYISEVVDEYPGDSESIGFLKYNLDNLFIHDTQKPFFADRLFSNRLVALAKSFRTSAVPNKIFIFKGPAGSGKSTFLNNLLDKFEQYMHSDKGLLYEVVWRIPYEAGIGRGASETSGFMPYPDGSVAGNHPPGGFLEIPCPNHDNPVLLIPRKHRADLLKEIIPQADLLKRIFKHRQYQWVLKNDPCTICSSLFDALSERFSIKEILSMIFARRYLFNRKQGIGLSIFNAGDDLDKTIVRTNDTLQKYLNDFFKDSNKVHYVFSSYAHTNQGVRALMDLKSRNVQRFLDLHGIISDEVHKVLDLEERIQSLFIVLMNPGDLEQIARGEEMADGTIDTSLKDRIHEILVPYVLDYHTEIKISILTFGDQIKLRFMPHVLENFAKIIISSRIKKESKAIKEWVKNQRTYEKYCDPDFFILKMELYSGLIPEWLTKEDRDSLKADVRRAILAESEGEGHEGFSGRESLQIFNEFYSRYSKKRPITMGHLNEFFRDENNKSRDKLPRDFLKHLTNLYDFEVLKEVKDSMYAFNEEEISKTILNYLVAIPHNVGDVVKNPYLGNEEFVHSTDFLDIVENHLIGYNAPFYQRVRYREEAITEYASYTLAREVHVEGRKITETKQYQEMFAQFTRTARESVLEPYVNNNNFRCAVKEFGTSDFEKYDSKLKEKILVLFKNLNEKYSYSTDSARTGIIYVLDNDLVHKFKP
ncbi:MAG: serine protein kinase PrkA [Candidatus Riflebacteria bacterium]|nr:serine protein kinase PrkA [Candidatus Riflebacteria bacterium]